MLIQTRYYDIIFDINLIAWSRVRSRFVGKYNEKKRPWHCLLLICALLQCLMSYCSEFEPVVTNPFTIPPFILVHLHTSFTRLLNHTFLLKFAFYGVSLFSPNLVSTISPSYFATGQSVEDFSTLMIKRRCKTTY